MSKDKNENSNSLKLYKLKVISQIEDLIVKLNKNKITLKEAKIELIVMSNDVILRINDKKSFFRDILKYTKDLDVIVKNNELEQQLKIFLKNLKEEVNGELVTE